MDDLLQLGKQALASQPFSVLVGAELTGYSPGWAELTIPITPQLKQQHGFVHGGLISYAADNALTFVGGERSRPGSADIGVQNQLPAPCQRNGSNCQSQSYLLGQEPGGLRL